MANNRDIIEFDQAPGFGAQYLRFFLKGKKRFDDRPRDLVAGAVVKGLRADGSRVAKYREACGFEADGALPLPYPHILTSSTHMSLMARDTFPLSPLGAVHARNHILQRRPLPEDGAYDLRCTMDYGAFRVVKQGAEADIVTEASLDGETVWESVSTYLFRGKFGEPDDPHPLAQLPETGSPDHDAEWAIPKYMGKRYAGITGDYNPIHMNKYAAKLFGFPRDIIHGMWNLARAMNHLPPLGEGPSRLDVLFKGPAFIGSTMTLQAETGADTRRFDCFCGDNPRPVIAGSYRRASADESLQ